VVRLDGRAFHTYCKGLARPFDAQFMADMDAVAIAVMGELGGVRLAYIQSDEISLVLTDWRNPASQDTSLDVATQFPFNGKVQKLVSVAAAAAATHLNLLRHGVHTDKVGLFDARAFSIPTRAETVQYLSWRQRDAQINATSMAASAHFTHRELNGVSTAGRREMLSAIGFDVDMMPAEFRNGRVIVRELRPDTVTYRHKVTGQRHTADVLRTVLTARPAPIFDEDDSLVPAARRPPTYRA
jgi:tRNA(His) guanylyltransferase